MRKLAWPTFCFVRSFISQVRVSLARIHPSLIARKGVPERHGRCRRRQCVPCRRTQQGLDDNRMQVGPVQDLPLNLPDNVTNRMVAQLLQLSPARRPGAPQILQAGPVTSAELRPRPHGPYSPVQVGRRRDTSERSVETSGGLPLGARPSTSLDASVGHPLAPPGAASPRQTRSSSSSSSSAAVAPPSPPSRRHQGPRRR
jgi:hypothetical protein